MAGGWGEGRRRASTIGLYGLVALGLVATLFAVRDEQNGVRQADERARC